MDKRKCNRETEVYSRVVGFYRPTKLWNKGKKEEFRKRVEFSLSKKSEIEEQLEVITDETESKIG